MISSLLSQTIRSSFILLTLAAIAFPTYANGRRPSRGRLAKSKPKISVFSYNGVRNSGSVRRNLDPMAVSVQGGVQPDSRFAITKQLKSNPARIEKQLKGHLNEKKIESLATKATRYSVKGLVFTPNVASTENSVSHTTDDSRLVLRPNTRIRIIGKTRDGDRYEPIYTKVGGLGDVNVSQLNPLNKRVESHTLSGRYLPSAEAWAEPKLLLMSQPVRDYKSIGKGKSYKKIARRHKQMMTYLNQKIATLEQKIAANNYQDPAQKTKDQNIVTKLKAAIPKIQSKVNYFTTKSTKLIASGKQRRSLFYSVAGVPADTKVTTVNTRLAGEGSNHATTEMLSDKKTGFYKSEIHGINKDSLRTTVSFPGGSSLKGSQVIIEHRIPDSRDPNQKPVATIGSKKRPIRLYQIKPENISSIHEPADQR